MPDVRVLSTVESEAMYTALHAVYAQYRSAIRLSERERPLPTEYQTLIQPWRSLARSMAQSALAGLAEAFPTDPHYARLLEALNDGE